MLSNYADLGLEFEDPAIAKNYETGRAGYTDEIVQAVLEAHIKSSGLPTGGLVIAEPGIGTGLLAEAFFAFDEKRSGNSRNAAVIKSYYGSDPSKAMLAGISRQPHLRNEQRLHLGAQKITDEYAPSGQAHLIVTGQSKHWDTRAGKINESVERTLGLLAKGGSEFAIFNAPIDSISGFTKDLNAVLHSLCPDPYYIAMTSGDAGRFLGDEAKSNFADYFNELAARGNGEIFYRAIHNPKLYKNAEEITAYVFSNAFVKNAVKNNPEKETKLRDTISFLFNKHFGEVQNGVLYGNTAIIFGAVGLKNDTPVNKKQLFLPTKPLGRNDLVIPEFNGPF